MSGLTLIEMKSITCSRPDTLKGRPATFQFLAVESSLVASRLRKLGLLAGPGLGFRHFPLEAAYQTRL